jgi:hypothetical protein
MRMPGRAPKAEGEWEAKADDLTPLGEPFRCGPVEFPKGEWVAVSEGMAKRLVLYGWASVREKKAES